MDRRTIAVGIVLITAAEALAGHHESAILPDAPDLGAEWSYNPPVIRASTHAIGSNSTSARAGVAQGFGTAFDAPIDLS